MIVTMLVDRVVAAVPPVRKYTGCRESGLSWLDSGALELRC